jgi:hypothetical protein
MHKKNARVGQIVQIGHIKMSILNLITIDHQNPQNVKPKFNYDRVDISQVFCHN